MEAENPGASRWPVIAPDLPEPLVTAVVMRGVTSNRVKRVRPAMELRDALTQLLANLDQATTHDTDPEDA